MDPNTGRQIAATTAVATIYAIVGALALGAAMRLSGRGRVPALMLAWAMIQHSVNQLTGGPLPRMLGVASPATTWIGVTTGYFIAVPWALLLQRMLGRGWRSSIRITVVAYIVSATVFTLLDFTRGEPGASAEWSRAVVAGGALVAFGNLFFAFGHQGPLNVVRAGILVFMALVVHDALARSQMLPWRVESGAWAVMICVTAIAYTVVTETMRRRSEMQVIEHELATARRIQSSLLPDTAPMLDGASIVFRYEPATAVAGDIFDFIAAARRQIGILVADVSGHGVPAALIASMVKVAAAAQKPHADDPARVLAGIHLALADDLPHAHFVTACYVYVDLDRGMMRHASAGHPPPLVWRAVRREFAAISETGPLIIGFAPAVYPVTDVPLAAGDRVVLYTDGITEAMRPDGEMFGLDRLKAIVADTADGPRALANAVIKAAVTFRGKRTAGLEDDCTLVVLEVER